MTKLWAAVAVVLAVGCGEGSTLESGEVTARSEAALARSKRTPDGKQLGTLGSNLRKRQKPNGFAYHGGPMMLTPTNVYFIWYGQWTDSPTIPVLTDLASNLGGSPYFEAVTTYQNEFGVAPVNAVIYSGAIADEYSMGASLSDSDVALVVSQAIAGGMLPADPDAVYVVLLSPDVNVTSGLCTSWCAAHNSTSANGVQVSYAVIGNPARCPSQCATQISGPSGVYAADAMASLIAAQLFNSVTDPRFTAWYDRNALEGADKCGWTYGETYQSSNGKLANVQLGGRDYLLQQLWWVDGRTGTCAMAPPATTPGASR